MNPLPRTTEEIKAKIEVVRAEAFFEAQVVRLVSALPWEDARSYLVPEFKEEDWKPMLTTKDVRDQITDYLPFAWEKANNCRGLSARRSLEHFRGLLWLLGAEGELVMDHPSFSSGYAYYGKEALVRVSKFVGFDWKKVDNDQWTNYEGRKGQTAAEVLGDRL